MKYRVRTQATVLRSYIVEADDEKRAIAQSTFVSPETEEDHIEETLSVEPVESLSEHSNGDR